MIAVVDAGTTMVKLAVYDEGKLVKLVREPIRKHTPQPGWVEIDAEDLARKCIKLVSYAAEKHEIEAIAMTNQRATAVLWDEKTGKPIMPAVGWQDTRAEPTAAELNRSLVLRAGRAIGKLTSLAAAALPGLKASRRVKWLITVSKLALRSSHMSVKLKWMLGQLGEKASRYRLKAGTIDSWLVYKLTGEHATDYSNAAATGIYDMFYMRWSRTILDLIEVSEDMLPAVKPSDEVFGEYKGTPVVGVIADQSASLYALGCWEKGSLKVTNGTGSFIDLNVGEEPTASTTGLLPLIAWKLRGEVRYMLEGMVTYSGAAIELMRDLGLYSDVKETSDMAYKSRNETLLLIPAFTALGTPYYTQAPGLLYGISNTTTREDIVKALLEAIAFRITEVIELMRTESWKPKKIRCDGEASSNSFLLQAIADTTGLPVERAALLSGSSYGAYLIAGRALGKWRRGPQIPTAEVFHRKRDTTEKYERWRKLLKTAITLRI